MEQYDLYENESFANQLREKALKSKQFKLECFIKDFSELANKAAEQGKTYFSYYCIARDKLITEEIGDWLRKEGFSFKVNSDQRDGDWLEITF
ncbi:hypothetical protein [Escherichia coli]|uniref:hypothetical protein n=1 Tax=Escherichia coli TaxID=562 RepID=UPI001FF28B48|nr:hypothetical protein [Escherichia coli]